ncbi:glycoside hydrolase family 127 protein [Alteribacillus sp. HJP-4]|uniref:glycoside hydrolase family 127 protein n=1 Tax=Alteribacillus sp. HJP-4 TaxID=2775394 RepID=UPI0035CD2BDB
MSNIMSDKLQMEPISLKNVVVEDAFWTPWQKLVKESIIPYQWDALNDRIPGAEPSGTIRNFEIAAGRREGTHYGMVFQDSDLYKWMEAVAFSLQLDRDSTWEQTMDEVIDLLAEAQEANGYLNSYYTVKEPDNKWTNVKDDHELYCAGHLFEAAAAYYEATGKSKIMDICSRFVDHIIEVFGREEGKKKGYPGHPEIELALMKLYRATGENKYVSLCQFFIEERGQQPPHYFDIEKEKRGGTDRFNLKNYDYFQAHAPIKEQTTPEGHAVRAVYLYSGIADLAAQQNDEQLLNVARTLWKNTIDKRMYITGGIGSSEYQERFTVDYDLPNDRAYTETCAAISLIFWAHRMLQIDGDREYADIMELALYNGALSGISLDGQSYFYVNSLEVWPHTANHRHDMSSVKTTRQPWFGCACCPPNIARLLASLGQYVYSKNESEIYVHLFMQGETDVKMNGNNVKLQQQTQYPWQGNINITVQPQKSEEFAIAVRIPGWCQNASITVNGEKVQVNQEGGYAKFLRTWKKGDEINIELDMPVEVVRSHPEVRENAGKVALKRGPVVYCLEEKDNGSNLQDIEINEKKQLEPTFEPHLLNGVVTIQGKGTITDRASLSGSLYTTSTFERTSKDIKAVPYYAWSNRGEGEMIVWIRN